MAIKLDELPFELDALEPSMSRETLEYHYGKHHAGYVEKLNKLIKGTSYDRMNLEDIVIESANNRDEKILHNAAQAWNHGFFWNCLTPTSTNSPLETTESALKENFGSVSDFKEHFSKEAGELFGSGWTWLVREPGGKLAIHSLTNELDPILQNSVPLLTCDVWEHAYYLDYRNERPKFIENFWKVVNWEFVEQNIRLSETGREPFLRTHGTAIAAAEH